MAKDMKKDATDLSIEEKLKNLYQLQTMLSEIDKIKTLRGELPLEVQDLEDEIEGLSTRIEKIHGEIGDLNADIAARKANIETCKAAIEKYTQQLDNVRNNREYDSLTKEIEYQTLDVELNEKRIREACDGNRPLHGADGRPACGFGCEKVRVGRHYFRNTVGGREVARKSQRIGGYHRTPFVVGIQAYP